MWPAPSEYSCHWPIGAAGNRSSLEPLLSPLCQPPSKLPQELNRSRDKCHTPPLSSRMASPRERASAGQVRKLPWCLYLPGFCIHSVPAAAEDELHHIIPNFPAGLIFHPFVEHPIHEHPAFRSPLPPQRNPSPLVMHRRIPFVTGPSLPELAMLINDDKAFENTSTSVAASQMRNALNNLADTVTDPEEKKVRPASALSLHCMETDPLPAL